MRVDVFVKITPDFILFYFILFYFILTCSDEDFLEIAGNGINGTK